MSDAYPLWWDTTLTIYNRYIDDITYETFWYKHYIDNCFWKNTYDEVRIGTTVLLSNVNICRIPQSDNFMEYGKWRELSKADKPNYFTLCQGHIIVKGEAEETIDEIYPDGRNVIRSTELIKRYTLTDGCMEIDNFVINIGGGRNNPHYFVKGQ